LILQQDGLVRSDRDHGELIFGACPQHWTVFPTSFGWIAARGLISGALENWEPRILGKFRIGGRELALIEDRAAVGLDPPHELAVGAKANILCRFFSRLPSHPNQNNARPMPAFRLTEHIAAMPVTGRRQRFLCFLPEKKFIEF